ncbi:MAG: TolC family protein [Armatimonadota bacterium]
MRIISLTILALAGIVLCGMSHAAVQTEPLTLDQCIAIALECHPALQGAYREVAGARAGVKASKSAALPQLAVAGAYTQNNGQPVGGFLSSPPEGFAAAVSVKQLLYDSGRTPAAIRDAKFLLTASVADYSDVEQIVALGVRQSYYGVLAAAQFVDAQIQARDLSQLHLEEARARYHEGIAPKADVTKAEVELSSAELGLIQAQNGVALAYAALNNALGIPPTTPVKLTGQLQASLQQPNLEDSLAMAYCNRPELKRIEAQIQSAQAKVKVAAAATKPAVYLAAGDIWPRTISGIGPVNGSNWTVGIAASQSIWDGGGTKARVEQANEAVGKLQADLANEKQQVGLEVQQAYLNVVDADRRVVAAAKLVEQADENYRIAEGRYTEGVGPMIDVVDAQTQLTAARASYVQAQLDAQVGRAKLDRATGQAVCATGVSDER